MQSGRKVSTRPFQGGYDDATLGKCNQLGVVLDTDLALFDGEAWVVVYGKSLAREREAIGGDGCSGEVCGAIESGSKGEFAGDIGREVDDDDLIGCGAEDLTGVLGASVGEGGGGDGGVEVEFEAVVLDCVDGLEVEV